MALYDGSVDLSGTSSSSLTGVVFHYGTIVASGSSSTTAAFERWVSGSAFFTGASDSQVITTIDSPSTTLSGSSASTMTGARIVSSGTLHFEGYGGIHLAEVLPAEGTSSTAIFGEVLRTNLLVKSADPKAFKWMQQFQRGDLSLFLCDGREAPVDVKLIFYALYQVKGQGRVARGPQRRIPSRGVLGEYYATGLAGESGQPGDWVIVWTYQVEPGDPLVNVEYSFRVVDAVVLAASNSLLTRNRKYGWD